MREEKEAREREKVQEVREKKKAEKKTGEEEEVKIPKENEAAGNQALVPDMNVRKSNTW